MNAQLAETARTVATGAHAILVPGGAGRHSAKHLAVPDNITLLTLPPYAPEINPVENVRAHLRANRPAITVFDTCDDIVCACCKAWNCLASDPKASASIASRDGEKVR